MRLAFPQYFTARARFLAYVVVAKALIRAGHTLTDDVSDCDAVLYSMCDVMEYPGLVKLRGQTDRPLVVGGSYAYHFRSALLYADAVWVGECYEMADCRTLDELLSHPSCYTGGRLPRASTLIRWEEVPVAQIAPRKAYYWGGQGCKGKCGFCLTSWTHPHQVNTPARLAAAKRTAKEHGLHLMICANEYSQAEGGRTQDMLLRDYLRTPVQSGFVRLGVEFATEESRRRTGKPISDQELAAAIRKMARERVSLRLFHISGWDSRQDWEDYIERLAGVLDECRPGRLLHLMFNNLQYQNYTPLYRRRREIDPERYLDFRDTRRFFDRLRMATPHVLVGAPSPFQHVAARMGVELATDRGQVDFWRRCLTAGARKLTVDEAYRTLFSSGVLDTPELRMDFRSGEIREVETYARAETEPGGAGGERPEASEPE